MSSMKLATAGEDIRFWNWNAVDFTLEVQHSPHQGLVSDISWSNDGLYLASVSLADKKIAQALVKTSSATVVELFPEEKQTCLRHANTTLHYLATGGENGKVNIWDLRSQKLKKTFVGHTQPVSCVSFNSNDSHIASASVGGEIILHNVQTGTTSKPLHHKGTQSIKCVRYQKSMLGSASEDGAVNLWDCNSHRLIYSFNDTHVAPATGIVFSPLNDILFCSVGLDKRIVCYDIKQKQAVKTIIADAPLTCVDMPSTGVGLLVGTSQGKVIYYDLRSFHRPLRTWHAHKTSVQRVMFQPSARALNKNPRRSSLKSQQKVAVERLPSVSETAIVDNTPHVTNSPPVNGWSPEVKNRSSLASESSFMNVFSPINGGCLTSVSSVDSPPDGLRSSVSSDRNSYMDIFSPAQEVASSDSSKDDVFLNQGDISPIIGDNNNLGPRTKKPVDILPFSSVDETNYELNCVSPIPPHVAVFPGRQKKPAARPLRRRSTDEGSISSSLSNVHHSQQTGRSLDNLSSRVSPLVLAGETHSNSNGSSLSSVFTSTLVPQESSSTSQKSTTSKLAYKPAFNPMPICLELNSPPTSGSDQSGHTATPPVGDVGPSANNVAAGVLVNQDGGAAAFNQELIRNMMYEVADELRDDLHQDIVNLRVDILRDVLILQRELNETFLSLRDESSELREENRRLREENQRLRSHY